MTVLHLKMLMSCLSEHNCGLLKYDFRLKLITLLGAIILLLLWLSFECWICWKEKKKMLKRKESKHFFTYFCFFFCMFSRALLCPWNKVNIFNLIVQLIYCLFVHMFDLFYGGWQKKGAFYVTNLSFYGHTSYSKWQNTYSLWILIVAVADQLQRPKRRRNHTSQWYKFQIPNKKNQFQCSHL